MGLGQLEGNIYAERGRTYELRGDWNCAIADYQKALALLSDLVQLDACAWLSKLG
jgi:tetratricopeptide (TPR) repeat protein